MEKELEGNRLIAEFMGLRHTQLYSSPGVHSFKWRNPNTNDLMDVSYHKSWDWLMPVVEKIESIKLFTDKVNTFYVVISHYCKIEQNGQHAMAFEQEMNYETIEKSADTKIESVWQAVVEFIKWYNTQKH